MFSTTSDSIDRVAPTCRPVGQRVVMYQRWERLLFLHWEVPVAMIQRLLPPGLEVDTFGGRAYVGLVPFTMKGVRPAGMPSVRGLSNFHETNVRTYVHVQGRDPGVWFFSLDAANLVGASLGRSWFRLPYFYARMSLRFEERTDCLRVSYASTRIFPRPLPASTNIVAEVSSPVVPAVVGTVEHFLAERYLLYAARGGKLLRGQVHHSPYPLQLARVQTLEESAVIAAGIERPDVSPLAHYASGVAVEVFGLEAVETRRR